MDEQLPMGYMGQSLHIDLTGKTYEYRPIDPELADKFFGGRGFGIAFLFKHFKELESSGKYHNAFSETDPLSEDNVLVISTSPATGTRMPTSGRIHMNFKSPLTGALGSANAGGRWGVAFKKTGSDAIIITGKAKHPVVLVVTNSGVAFHDAGDYSDLDAVETRSAIREKMAKNTQMLVIGQAGKTLSNFASVLSDKGKALGRGGGGAVFGSKNLYAIAVQPDPGIKIDVHDTENLRLKNKNSAAFHAKLKLDIGKFTKHEENYGILSSMGSLGILGMVDNFDQLVHNNMKDTRHAPEQIGNISGEALRNHAKAAKPGEERIEVRKGACFNCPIVCKRETRLIDREGRTIETGEGPEFESVALLGANLSIYDLPVITKANNLANRFGLDTISLGSTIASFFELYHVVSKKESPLLPPEEKFMFDVEDFVSEFGEPKFGRSDLLLPLIDLIGTASGIGAHLSTGSYRFCKRYGHESLSMSVKKLELPAYDPRSSFTQALCYEMNNRGGCHLEGGYTAPQAYCAGYAEWPADRIDGTPLISKNAALKNTALDIIGACAYGSFSLGLVEYAHFITAVTGKSINSGTLKLFALRTLTLERGFNHLCGLTADDDWLPRRFYTESIMVGDKRVACDRNAFVKMHQEYYHSLGWDDNGKPTSDTLEALGLGDLDLLVKDLTL
jgi:aldehyde:ferredoxin oxidoreductase